MANRPIGFENHYADNSGADPFPPSGHQPPYGYPPMNTSPGYGHGYGAAYPPAVVNEPGFQQIESYPMHHHTSMTPTPSMPVVDAASGPKEYIPPTVSFSPRAHGNEPMQQAFEKPYPSKVESVARSDTPEGRRSPSSAGPKSEHPERYSLASGKRLLEEENQDHREIMDNQKDQMFFKDGKRKIDYILAYQKDPNDEKSEKRRDIFEKNLEKAGLQLEREENTDSSDGLTYFVKVHAPMPVLYKGAELMHMKMPIKINDLATPSKLSNTFACCHNPFALDTKDIEEEENYFTCPFHRDKKREFHEANSPDFFTNAQRSIIVQRYLMKMQYEHDKMHIGINRMVSKGHYSAAYPLHEGEHKSVHSLLTHKPSNDRQVLYYHWARFNNICKEQPLDLIRKYFGEKVGLYFSWLGFYTIMLIPAAIVGVISIIYGLLTVNDFVTVKEICSNKSHFLMCPRCDVRCPYWSLVDSCVYSKVAYVLDNPFTVVFAILMSFWATCFLEVWKRKQAEISYDWDLIGFEDEEEQPRAEYENKLKSKSESYKRRNPITEIEEPFLKIRKKIPNFVCSIFTVVFMITLVIAAMLGVIVYRVAVTISLAKSQDFEISWISLFASFTAAFINLLCIMILNKLYEWIAFILTKWELPRTQTNFDDSYTFKMYLFQFVNFYGSLFYIAFFKLDPGRPGKYNTIFGFRREECNPAGCLFELGVQLFVIMVGKQIFNTFIEVFIPKIKNWWRKRKNLTEDDSSNDEAKKIARWDKDYKLTEISDQGLFDEYLEMVIQFGFITLFVAAFPLGPFFALINNMIEIRVDAYKFVVLYRRSIAQKVQDIGIWYPILESVVKLSVIVNAFVIAFVSEFVQRLYYRFAIRKDGQLDGFISNSLSCFDVRDFPSGEGPKLSYNLSSQIGNCSDGLPYCRYRGYYEPPYMTFNGSQLVRNPKAYEFRVEHWHIIAAKLFFVIAFEHLIFFLTGFLAWIIPDVPKELDNQVKREAFLARNALMTEELGSPAYDEEGRML